MRKRVITAAVGVVGLVVIGLGVASATLWRADDVLVATATASTHVVVSDPGVLELGGDPATVRVTAAGSDVVAVVGRDTDVDGWVGSDPYTRVTGLSGWDALATTTGEPVVPTPGADATPDPAATGTPAPTATAPATTAATAPATAAATADPSAGATPGTDAPAEAPAQVSPAGNDNWVAEASGKGSVELVWPAQSGRWSLLAVSTGAAEPTVEISWPRVVTTPWLWPCVVVGALLALGAALVLLRGWSANRAGSWEPVHTGTVPVVPDGRPLTRRELREAAQASRGGSGQPHSGALPRVTGAQQVVPPHDEGRHASSTDPRTAPASAPAPSPMPPAAGQSAPLSRRAMRSSGTPPTATVPAVPSGAPASPNPARPAASAPGDRLSPAPTADRAAAATTERFPSVPTGGPPAPASSQPSTTSPRASSAPPVEAPPAAGTAPRATPPTARPEAATAATGPALPGPVPASPATSAGVSGRSAWGRRPGVGNDLPATPAAAPQARPEPTVAVGGPTPAPDQSPSPEHGGRTRPSWLGTAGATAASTRSVGAGPTPAGPAGGPTVSGAPGGGSVLPTPGGWIPRGPDPDASSSPARPAPTGDPGAEGTGPRPADPAGSRADAWRRAWGLPAAAEPESGGQTTDTPDQGTEPREGDR